MGELGHWDSRFYRTLSGLFMRQASCHLNLSEDLACLIRAPVTYVFLHVVDFVGGNACVGRLYATSQSRPIA